MIKRKYKPCGFEGCDQCLYARGVCYTHYRILYFKPIKRTPIKKSTCRINPISDKEKQRQKKYREAKVIFWSNPANKKCKAGLPGCTEKATQVHHKKGKIGSLLWNILYFIGLCANCHRLVEDNPEMAYEKKLSLYRNRVN